MAQLKKALSGMFELGKALPDEEVAYCRVSTDDQDPAFQIALMKKRGIPEDNIFVDEGVSGRKINRPQLSLALKLMEGRPGWTLVVWKLDRLGRDALGLMELAKQFLEKGWNLVSLTEQIDTRTPFGRFYFGLLAHLAQLESDMTGERTRAGMLHRQAMGGNIGRVSKITTKQWIGVERLLLAKNPKTIADIAKQFGVSKSAVNNHFPGWRVKSLAERKAWRAKHPLPVKAK